MAEKQSQEPGRPDGQPVTVVDGAPRVELDPALTQGPTTMVHVPSAAPGRTHAVIVFDDERHKILTDTIMPSATPAEVEFFKLVCIRTGLDPFARQIHAVKRSVRQKVGTRWDNVDRWSFQVAIDGFRLIAERTGKYRGQELPLYCGDDGVWREVWLSRTPPRACLVAVLHADFDAPLRAVALWDEFVQTKDEYEGDRKTGNKIPAAMWAKMPALMLAKVAEALALRKAFPQELSGLYTDDEMAQADNATEEQHESRRRSAPRAKSGDRASVSAGAGAGSGDQAAFTNGTAMIFPYGPLRERGVTLDATYNAGATRTRKRSGQPDEVIECGGQFVVSDKRLSEAAEWVRGKLQKHQALESAGETAGEGWLDMADIERLIGWGEDLSEEQERREYLRIAAEQVSEGRKTMDPTSEGVSHDAAKAPTPSPGVAGSETHTPTPSGTSTDQAGAPATTTSDDGSLGLEMPKRSTRGPWRTQ